RADGIDILVDLAGHTRHNRLDAFAYYPAPVQVTYLGYPNTTGIPTVGYRIVDSIINPPGQPSYCSAELVRLPGCFVCFTPPTDAPALTPLPLRANGHITFGSHHPTIKLNNQVLALWGRVLAAVPRSRLVMMRNLFTPAMVGRWEKRLSDHG